MPLRTVLDSVKRKGKAALGHLAYRTGLYRRYLTDRAVIVVFHRVDDALDGDHISVTTRAFREFCGFFGRYFHIVSPSELLDKLRAGEDISGHLAITFDDGYKDNFTNAAPELLRQKLPACFFVATNFIESNAIPWWDAEVGITPEWMTWDDVRTMHRQGFEFGPHTLNHIDLGKVVGEEACTEIAGSKAKLESELQAETTLFSFPYGRPHQMCDDNREIVEEAGLSCCMSAHGGVVTPDTDPYDVPRMAISNWYLSTYQFGFELLLAFRRSRGMVPRSRKKIDRSPEPAIMATR